jgi:hypothetical protein
MVKVESAGQEPTPNGRGFPTVRASVTGTLRFRFPYAQLGPDWDLARAA